MLRKTEVFSERISRRDAALPVVLTKTHAVSRDALTSLRPPKSWSGGERVALSIESTGGLLRALSALDGRVSAILLLSSTLSSQTITDLAHEAGCTIVLSDRSDLAGSVALDAAIAEGHESSLESIETTWIMTTSGTTGRPKMICHTLNSLSRTVKPPSQDAIPASWGLVYEPTRFAGLQVLLQACLGGGILIAPNIGTGDIGETLGIFVNRGCTHLSATPTLWRRILMHPVSKALRLQQITLGGEIADQRILDSLRTAYPVARITHLYASTETGVGFSVYDGFEGFPARFLKKPPSGIGIKIVDGRLWLRSSGAASEYLGSERLTRDAEGFVDTLDRVDYRGDRVVFLGRENGAVNVGGAKVYPEMVEGVLQSMPEVALACVTSRRNSLSGAVLVATVVPTRPVEDAQAFKTQVIQYSRDHLPREARLAMVTIADSLETNSAGKLSRN